MRPQNCPFARLILLAAACLLPALLAAKSDDHKDDPQKLKDQITSLQKQVDDLRKQLDDARKQPKNSQTDQVSSLQKQNGQLRQQLGDLRKQLDSARRDAADQQRRYADQVNSLARQVQDLSRQLDNARRTAPANADQICALQSQNDDLRRQLDDARKTANLPASDSPGVRTQLDEKDRRIRELEQKLRDVADQTIQLTLPPVPTAEGGADASTVLKRFSGASPPQKMIVSVPLKPAPGLTADIDQPTGTVQICTSGTDPIEKRRIAKLRLDSGVLSWQWFNPAIARSVENQLRRCTIQFYDATGHATGSATFTAY